ncbi:pilin [Thiorhodococcus minor]|uniref:pilin n=1 Tax=Thiorhodococcus minor TaxID=57489 RepID=UPI003CC91A6C
MNSAAGGWSFDVTFGNRANQKIAGQLISVRSTSNGAGGLVWVCGTAPQPAGLGAPPVANATTIATKFMPTACRP